MTKTKMMEIPADPVTVVEADVFDRMNETNDVIKQRAYEFFQARGGGHGADMDDWFSAEAEILKSPHVTRNATPTEVTVLANVAGFAADDLEVTVGHKRAVICGIHPNAGTFPAGTRQPRTRVMRIIELPYRVDPRMTSATLRDGTLRIVLPRLAESEQRSEGI